MIKLVTTWLTITRVRISTLMLGAVAEYQRLVHLHVCKVVGVRVKRPAHTYLWAHPASALTQLPPPTVGQFNVHSQRAQNPPWCENPSNATTFEALVRVEGGSSHISFIETPNMHVPRAWHSCVRTDATTLTAPPCNLQDVVIHMDNNGKSQTITF